MGVAIDGVLAAGNLPIWIIPAASITSTIDGDNPQIPLTAFTDPATVKADCYMDFGDITVNRQATTRERQRICQKVTEQIETGETIDLSIASVYDQQADLSAEVNKVYSALPPKSAVFIAIAYGWDTDTEPDSTIVFDLYRANVQSRIKSFPASADEDLKVTASLTGSAYYQDVTISD